MDKSWSVYYEDTKLLKPSKFLIEAFETFKPAIGAALDLGCGTGRDTSFLLEKGYNVVAVDKESDAMGYLSHLPSQDNLNFICSDFNEFDFGRYEVVNAHYSLPFARPGDFEEVMAKVLQSVKPGGLFVGQLFGADDEWNIPNTKMSFCKRDEIENLFNSFEKLQIHEVNEIGKVANGTSKHWHVFNIVAQKFSN